MGFYELGVSTMFSAVGSLLMRALVKKVDVCSLNGEPRPQRRVHLPAGSQRFWDTASREVPLREMEVLGNLPPQTCPASAVLGNVAGVLPTPTLQVAMPIPDRSSDPRCLL